VRKTGERWNNGMLEEWGKLWGRMESWKNGKLGKNEVLRPNIPSFQYSNIPLFIEGLNHGHS
jgi:hypothetical protein